MITNMASTGDMQGAASLYQTIYPQAQKVLGPNLPAQLDPSMLPHMKQIADTVAPQTKKDDAVYHAGDQVYGPDGKLKISVPDKAPNFTAIKTDQGYAAFNPRDGSAQPVNYAGG